MVNCDARSIQHVPMSNLLLHFFGWPATLIHGDPMVLDRWRFLGRRLPKVRATGQRVLDIGCGTGALTMGIARCGYDTVGLSWDERNQKVATDRAAMLGLKNVTFPIGDARHLDKRKDFITRFDAVVCFENIEHILNDRKLVQDMFRCLKPGGRLYLTSPNYNYRPLSAGDMGPFSSVEDGSHVRRGYTPCMLHELCQEAGFEIEEITFISHFFSQIVTRLGRASSGIVGGRLAWLIILPLRPLPLFLDDWLGQWLGSLVGWPGYSIALVAYKSRFGLEAAREKESRCTATARLNNI